MTDILKKNTDKIELNQGVKIPVIALGTCRANEGEAREATRIALQNGYRHIDTAFIYSNEEEVGEGIRDSGVPREEIFVTTKLWNFDHKRAEAALDDSLRKLGLDYVDLYLIHWPYSEDPETKSAYKDWDYIQTYKELQKLQKMGKTKAIGVSNFTINKLKKLMADPEVTVKPAVNQFEAHPLLPQVDLYNYLKAEGIVIEAYAPLGSPMNPLFKVEEIVDIAKKRNVDPAQVLISWAVQRGTVPLPKSVNEARIISNLKTFKLLDEEFEVLNNLSNKYGISRAYTEDYNNFDD